MMSNGAPINEGLPRLRDSVDLKRLGSRAFALHLRTQLHIGHRVFID
jgi:hypothetical protein